jgi:hypothetical protein
MTRTEELLTLAAAATPGAWWSGKCEPTADGHALAWIGVHFVDCHGGQKNYKEQVDDAAFIAAANPETIKQLVELVRLQHSELVEWCSDIGMDSPAIEAFNKWEGE